jgi:hypothetical protein
MAMHSNPSTLLKQTAKLNVLQELAHAALGQRTHELFHGLAITERHDRG